jgi:hypothetical protein
LKAPKKKAEVLDPAPQNQFVLRQFNFWPRQQPQESSRLKSDAASNQPENQRSYQRLPKRIFGELAS